MLILRYLAVAALLVRAKSHKSLTDLGIVVAAVTGLVHTLGTTSLNIALLATFFLTSTRLTKVKAEYKKTLTVVSSRAKDGPRNHVQVLANSLFASVLILFEYFYGHDDMITVGVIAHYAAVTADTWASELGILSKSQPILITTLKPCPKGTNGGISLYGLTVSALGGALVGVVSVFLAHMFSTWSIIGKAGFAAFTTVIGLLGSLLDSLLGALFQASVVNPTGKIIEQPNGYGVLESEGKVIAGMGLLDNNEVNFLMASLTSIAAMLLWWHVYGSGSSSWSV